MILLVDDVPANLFSLRKILEHRGFTVDTATSGEEALKMILQKTYVLIILDVQMPGMDGFEVAEHISGMERTRNTAVMFLSANSTDIKLITKGYQLGAADYITKPVDPGILLLKVKTLYSLYESKVLNYNQQQEIEKSYHREKQLNETLIHYNSEITEAYQRYELVNLATNDVIWDWDIVNNRVQFNENICSLYGYSREEVGSTVEWWQNIIHPKDTQHLFTVFVETAHVKNKNCSCEYRMRTADGSYKDVFNQSYCQYGTDGKLLRIVSAVKDMSELKKTEKELLDTEFKLLQTIESIREGFFTCDSTWEVTYWNSQSVELLKLAKADAIGKNLWDLFPDARNTQFYKQYLLCIANQRPYSFKEYYAPSGRWYHVNVHPSGNGIAVYFEDITDELSKDSERKVIELKLQEIAYSNSHVIRKPLANILGLIELLNIEEGPQKELMGLIKTCSLELDDVIRKIANVAQS